MIPAAATVRAALRAAAYVCFCGVTLIAFDHQATSPDAAAEALFKTGQELLANGDYETALKDFETAASSYPTTAIADNALLEAARIRFHHFGDVEGARAATAKAKTFVGGDAAVSAYVLEVRMTVAVARAKGVLDSALIDMERIPTRYPGSAAAFPEAAYYAAEIDRFGGRAESALARYRDVIVRYSRSEWAARAYVGAALSSLRLGRPEEAIEALQRLRLKFPASSLAEKALHWNALIFRIYLRGAPYTQRSDKTHAARMNPIALTVVANGAVWLVGSNGAFPTIESKSAQTGFPGFNRAIYAHGPRGIVAASPNAAVDGRGATLRFELTASAPGRAAETLSKITAIAVTSLREFIVADEDNGVGRFSANGKAKPPTFPGRADRLAVDPDDNVALLTRGQKTVSVYNADGQPHYILGASQSRIELQDPFDLDVDELGHWYVLDRTQRAVLVFGPTGALVARIAPTPEEFRSAKAIAVDANGLLHVFDERQSRIVVYQ